ncbi:phage protein Gp36 family protein [Providencia manganoxydans]|uniref:phage protein Gp36 family protein n=1 Tax=Providencia manganoxydans TaxID=2923283 RepID=UPI0034E458C1
MGAVTYITAAQLCDTPGTVELSQNLAQDNHYPVPPLLLTARASGEAVDDWTADEVAQADTALARLQVVIEDTQSMIDGFLRQRGLKLPLVRIPRQLTTWARAIVRYHLFRYREGSEQTDPVIRDYKAAMSFLQKVADGRYSLGLDDPLPPAGGKPRHKGPARTFDNHTLRHFGK